MSDKTLKVGIVGTGNIADYHAKAFKSLAPKFEIVAIADLQKDRAVDFAEKHDVPNICADLEELLVFSDLDVVDLCTPPRFHVEQILSSLDAGLNVICEKPVAGSLADMDRIIAKETETGNWLMPIFQNRFDLEYRKIKALRDADLTGRHHMSILETSWLRGDAYYDGTGRGILKNELGGTLATHVIHAHDLLYHLVDRPSQVFARTSIRRDGLESEDLAIVSFGFADGSMASSTATLASQREISRYSFMFDHLTVQGEVDMESWDAGSWRFIASDPEVNAKVQAVLDSVPDLPGQFAGQFLALYGALLAGQKPPVTTGHAKDSIELLTAMYFSVAHSTDVTLPILPEHPYYYGWLNLDQL